MTDDGPGVPETLGLHHVTNICTDMEHTREFYEDALRAWQERLHERGVRVFDVRDRTYFKSIYLSDPDGLTIEFATSGPGSASTRTNPEASTSTRRREAAEMPVIEVAETSGMEGH